MTYPEAYERWTWMRQLMDDDVTKILSPLRIQGDGQCSICATATTLESDLRVQCGRSVSFSIPYLQMLDDESSGQWQGMTKVKRLMLAIKDRGVVEERHYEDIQRGNLLESDVRRYKVSKFHMYDVNEPLHIKHALNALRRSGPLLAVIRISGNYNKCYESGAIYRFDPNKVVLGTDGNPKTHAVSVVSFAIEANVPCLECQDSRGPEFGRGGFLMVDITSLKELYSIRIGLSTSS